jgi:hypothetical protein
MSLDLWMEICGKRPAEFYIEGVCEELMTLNFVFEPAKVHGSSWDLNKDEINHGNKWHFRD